MCCPSDVAVVVFVFDAVFGRVAGYGVDGCEDGAGWGGLGLEVMFERGGGMGGWSYM